MKIDELALEQIDERCREEVLGPAALAFLDEMHRRFEPRRRELLQARSCPLFERSTPHGSEQEISSSARESI